ncbi:MAG: hypothetical protein LBV60_22710 [Streptomyces sp.]|jgi:hypothetical protein|nr:hypothetical protein [Streptomyces sp.]
MSNDRLAPEREAEITARTKAASRGPWKLAYELCECSEDCEHGLYVSRINTGAGPATELCDLPNAEWELMVYAREDIDLLRAELAAVRAERDAFRDQRNAAFATNEQLLAKDIAHHQLRAEIRSSYIECIAQCEEDRDDEGAVILQAKLRKREERWKAEDEAATR